MGQTYAGIALLHRPFPPPMYSPWEPTRRRLRGCSRRGLARGYPLQKSVPFRSHLSTCRAPGRRRPLFSSDLRSPHRPHGVFRAPLGEVGPRSGARCHPLPPLLWARVPWHALDHRQCARRSNGRWHAPCPHWRESHLLSGGQALRDSRQTLGRSELPSRLASSIGSRM